MREMLTLADREEIFRGLAELLEYKDIAARIGRNPPVVSREVTRHGGREGYRATRGPGRGWPVRARRRERWTPGRGCGRW